MSANNGENLVTVTTTPSAATVTLNSPQNRNALSSEMMTQLAQCLDEAAHSMSRVIILTHSGSAFCSGLNLKDTERVDLSALSQLILAIRAAPQPTIAVLTGPARAGGLGLMASCDLVIATPNISFAFTEVKIGAVPALISAPVFERVSPKDVFAEFLTGNEFSASRALQIGLITHINDDPLSTAHDFASAMAKVGPIALRETTKLLRHTSEEQFAKHLLKMQQLSEQIFAGEEAQEGMAAFREKRSPHWKQS